MTSGGIIDLNADLGEGCGDDAAMLRIVTSASIACGGHAGDLDTMRMTVQGAIENGVSIGAHVSYPDREHFGRRDMQIPGRQLSEAVLQQLRELDACASACGTRIRYVKAHGALYNRMAEDAEIAGAVIAAIKQFDPTLMLLTLPDCIAMQHALAAGLQAVAEGFADRGYTEQGRLSPRDQPGAVLTDPETVSRRGVEMAKQGRFSTISGATLSITVRSLCVHGDTPGAVALARALRTGLETAGLSIATFA